MLFDDVVVFAHSYPYWSGPTAETYLEGEMHVIAEHAKRVHVVAFEGLWDTAPVREGLPPGLDAIKVIDSEEPLEEGAFRRFFQLKSLFSKEFFLDRRKIDTYEKLLAFTYYIRLSNRLARLAWRKLRERCPEFGTGPTLLYSFWFNEPARAAVLLANKMQEAGLKRPAVIARAHGYDCYAYRADSGYLPGQIWTALNLDAVYPCSTDGVAYLEGENPEAARKFHLNHLGTRDCGLGPVSEAEAPLNIVTCSRAVPLKRLDRIADALGVLNRRGIGFQWTCIGGGESLFDLKDKVAHLGIADSVRFTDSIDQAKVSELYRCQPFDVFVNASKYEGIPLSIMEAISFGIPVVATRVGGNPEIVIDGVNGCTVPCDFSDDMLADAIIEVGVSRSPRYREGARRVWEEGFDLRANAERLLADAAKYLR